MPNIIYCKPRQERRAKEHLEQQQFDCFLPLCRTRRSAIEQPLFPRYLFCWINDRPWGPIMNTPGVSHLLIGTNDSPCTVQDSVIEDIKSRMEEDGGAILVRDEGPVPKHFEPGQEIRVVGGAHLGHGGIFVSRAKNRVVALLNMFGREVRADIRADYVS